MLYNFALEDALTFVDFVLASIIIWWYWLEIYVFNFVIMK
jgi:hypothetical protein